VLAELSGDSRFADFAGQMSALSQNLASAAKGAQSGGWMGAIVGGLTDIMNQSFEAYTIRKQQDIIAEQNLIDFAREYSLSLLKIKEQDYESIFGIKSIQKASDALGKARDALKNYHDEINKKTEPEVEKEDKNLGMTVFGMGALGGWEWLGTKDKVTERTKILVDAYKKGYTDIQAMAIKTKDYSGWDEFWGKKDKYTSLKDLVPEMWEGEEFNVEAAKTFLSVNTQISDEQRNQIQAVIDLKEAYDDAIAVIDQQITDVFGDIASQMTDVIFDSIRSGSDAWEGFEKIDLEVIDTLGKQLLQEMMVGLISDKYRERMRKAYEGASPEAVQKEMMSITTDLFN
jgi:uncharacterized protein YbgA (DUF1722 family)